MLGVAVLLRWGGGPGESLVLTLAGRGEGGRGGGGGAAEERPNPSFPVIVWGGGSDVRPWTQGPTRPLVSIPT